MCSESSVKADPEGEGLPTREEEEEEDEEGEKMQANPAYLPIEMSYNSQERQYLNVMMFIYPDNMCINMFTPEVSCHMHMFATQHASVYNT